MGISAEWGAAADTTVTVAAQSEHIFSSDEPVSKPAALVIDPQSGGAMVIEGAASEIADVLDRARRALGPALAAEALADWKEYQRVHAQLLGDNPEQADQYENDRLPELARALAAALRVFIE
jgi:hypothetical protein